MSDTISEQINRRTWWHSPPRDANSYKKRGIFLASSYKECEFYGRPLDEPIKIKINNPLVNTERNIIASLFGENSPQMKAYDSLLNYEAKELLKIRFKLDAEIMNAAKNRGYDSVAIISPKGLERIKEGKLPRNVELNVADYKKVIRDNPLLLKVKSML